MSRKAKIDQQQEYFHPNEYRNVSHDNNHFFGLTRFLRAQINFVILTRSKRNRKALFYLKKNQYKKR